MTNGFRLTEFKTLVFRLSIGYVFYFLARLLFWMYNFDMLHVSELGTFLKLAYHGLTFDTAALLYANLLFIVLSILPLWINTKPVYQKILFYTYFISNLSLYALNFVDLIYYKFTLARTNLAIVDVLKDESNLSGMFFRFMLSYWHVFLLFIVLSYLWIRLYKKIQFKTISYHNIVKYSIGSLIGLIVFPAIVVGGIRGGFSKSTRPINLLDASRMVEFHEQADLVLNTPFAFLRTLGSKSFKHVHYPEITQEIINDLIQPIKQFPTDSTINKKPNVVLIITESYGREYIGAFNKDNGIENYVSYTPFLDSLANHSLIFTQAFANGYKSIHGMSSIISGIPSFKEAFTSSNYANQDITSVVSELKKMGYASSFYHGAPNGSMGFLGYSNILGIDRYYGKTEYNNDADFDGVWGIWDAPFLTNMAKDLSKEQEPFISAVFTITSHEPYIIPEDLEGKFPEGNIPMHKTVGYTDYAFKKFFEKAKKQDWYDNTIFVITADHCNRVYYRDEYMKSLNRNAIPILIYDPNGKYQGVSSDLAQQIDIYPTILDMAGYDKPFRSWGRSLVDTTTTPFVMNYGSNHYRLQKGNYICIFDGQKAVGFYTIGDKGLKDNLIELRNKEMDKLELTCKAMLQDYFNRIVDRNL
ncbi:MAG: phosphoglycerol transferase MdoB-like AlkP superfamily enzyme [Flavobacteriales bacterium]|jgi:phosphoglycerol transferase MdoB-like AlkP superfamily enzyme